MKVWLLAAIAASLFGAEKKQTSALQRYLESVGSAESGAPSPGSLWSGSGPYTDLGADLRARRLHDAITIVVRDRASAVAKGTVRSARASNASGGVNALGGVRTGIWPNLVDLGSTQQLDGEGETSRETVLTTALSGRVVQVLPNGDMVVHGTKSVRVNAEVQTVEVRGIVRPFDVSPGNTVLSDQLSFLEISVDGKGVVNDAVRRPNFLYRLLLGLLPF